MIPRRFALGLAAAAAFCALGMACADFTVGEILDDVETLATPLEESEDPEVRAVAEANAEIAREREAQESLQRALDTKEPNDLDEAIRVRPKDPRYVLRKIALLGVSGREGAGSEMQALFDQAGAIFSANETPGATRTAHMLSAYADVRDTFPKDSSQWRTLNGFYCMTYDMSLHAQRNNVVDAFFTAATYSNETCDDD